MTLVEATTGEVVADVTPADARILTEQIKTSVSTAWNLIAEAYTSRAWAALGYDGWDAYVTAEFGVSRLALPREERREVVASLRDAGLSTRAIAQATGADRKTVRRDLDQVGEKGPPATEPVEPPAAMQTGGVIDNDDAPVVGERYETVTGVDGKTYPIKPKPEPKSEPLTEEQQLEADRAEADQRTADRIKRAIQTFHSLEAIRTHPRRAQILSHLEDSDLAALAEIDRKIR